MANKLIQLKDGNDNLYPIATDAIYVKRGEMGVAPNTSRDFNDYVTSGTYYNGGTNTAGTANAPHSADNGYLIVNSFGAKSLQIWLGAYVGTLRVRRRTNTDTWTVWTTLY